MKKKMATSLLAASLLLTPLFSNAGQAVTEGQSIADRAKQYVGVSYSDSDGFIYQVLNKEGITIPSYIKGQVSAGKTVSLADLRPGDVLFYKAGNLEGNMAGIYIGSNKIVAATKYFGKISVIDMNLDYLQKQFYTAKRYTDQGNLTDPTANQPTSSPKKETSVKPNESKIRQNIIAAGKKYLGTPYEFGSDRSNARTLDSSEFVRWAYLDGTGIKLPSNGRTIANYIKQNGKVIRSIDDLQPGDIMFMMSYKGWKASDYAGIDVSKQTITHSGIYMGDGKIIHTYSPESGGVRIDTIKGKHWEYRFIFGGSIFK
ncbi:C40 family peptidase [Microaerobacter geothermalis]|uniref:C40 family peptidase n=1 Tax=Microaerobacter geothermalis TaxID=674972 RepID=UPI001F1ED82C|nr:NlpC/P60 family protein [Microaerobacter geothermalis]MCF6093046.1 C40 family peptidase [Microaerobacter geothermalis]